MGSLRDGTLCAYCDVEEAEYIPDGCCGPVCGVCMDAGIASGWRQIDLIRHNRWIRALLGNLTAWARRHHRTPTEEALSDPTVAVNIAEYVVPVTDRNEYMMGWSIPHEPFSPHFQEDPIPPTPSSGSDAVSIRSSTPSTGPVWMRFPPQRNSGEISGSDVPPPRYGPYGMRW